MFHFRPSLLSFRLQYLTHNPVLYTMYVHARVVTTLLLQSQTTRDWGADEIVPGLFLGNLADSLNGGAIKAYGVTHVVSAIKGLPSYPYHHIGVSHHVIDLLDVPDEDILSHLSSATTHLATLLHKQQKHQRPGASHGSDGGASSAPSVAIGDVVATPRVLVHCVQGKSRSATVVAAYMVRYLGYSPEDAVAELARRRPIVAPNPGFLRQLDAFAASTPRETVQQ